MKFSDEILSELVTISPFLAGLEKTNVFTVPEGYFNNLHTSVLLQIKSTNFTLLEKGNNIGLTVPEGYFENLSTNILNKIKAQQNENAADELKNLSPLLFSLQDKNVFTVPQQYFNGLSNNVVKSIRPQAKVISIKSKNTIWKIAAAAVMTGVIAISSLWVSQKQIDNKTGVAVNETITSPSGQYRSEDQINQGIAKLSDDEIIKYLQTTGTVADNESLAANIRENELPSQQDYLMDEKTLQKFLDETETNSSN